MTMASEEQYTPARVHIVADDTKPQPGRRTFVNAIAKTYTASATPELILPRSAGRRRAWITVLGVVGTAGNIVLCGNQADAGQAALVATEAGGEIAGCAMQPGMMIDITHNDEVWLARYTSTGTAPVVGVSAEYDALG